MKIFFLGEKKFGWVGQRSIYIILLLFLLPICRYPRKVFFPPGVYIGRCGVAYIYVSPEILGAKKNGFLRFCLTNSKNYGR